MSSEVIVLLEAAQPSRVISPETDIWLIELPGDRKEAESVESRFTISTKRLGAIQNKRTRMCSRHYGIVDHPGRRCNMRVSSYPIGGHTGVENFIAPNVLP